MNIIQQLKNEEGVIPHAYQDSLGFWTIGVGRLIDQRKGGLLYPDEIEYLLANDVKRKTDGLNDALPWFHLLDERRQAVLIQMAFQMGLKGLLAFSTTLSHVRVGRYAEAAVAMLESIWAKQTPERAKRLSKQMETGEWQ
jgi:lysozyme